MRMSQWPTIEQSGVSRRGGPPGSRQRTTPCATGPRDTRTQPLAQRSPLQARRWAGRRGAIHGQVVSTEGVADDRGTVATLSCHHARTTLAPLAVPLARFGKLRERLLSRVDDVEGAAALGEAETPRERAGRCLGHRNARFLALLSSRESPGAGLPSIRYRLLRRSGGA
jgi:hypothetical protein